MPAAIAIPLITAAASTGASIIGAKMSANASKNAAKVQTDSANHAADVGKQSNDEALVFQRQQAENDWRAHEAAQRANYDQYLARYNAAKGLGASMGFALPDAKAYMGSEDPRYDSPDGGPVTSDSDPRLRDPQHANDPASLAWLNRAGGPGNPNAAATTGGKGSASELQALLTSGMDPQRAVAQFNQQYGRTTGNEAVYYGPEVHGKASIGLPDAYLSLESNGWSITPRGRETAGGGSAAGGGAPLSSSIASYLPTGAPSAPGAAPLNAPQSLQGRPLAPPPDFRLRSVASFMGGR